MELRVDAVSKIYGTGNAARLAIEPTSVAIEEEQFVTIVGPSGCGKSTLLMMMAGLLDPTAGRVMLGDEPIDGPPFGLSVVFQDYSRSLFPWMNVRRNLSMAASAYRLPKPN